MSIDLSKPAATSITIQPEPKKPYEYTTGKKVAATEAEFLGHEGGFGFSDLIDLINPLQHIPIVSTIYRKITGDEIGPGAKVLGGGIFGGITGLISSVADAIFAQETGSDTGDTVFAAATGEQKAKTAASIATAEKLTDEKEASLAASGMDAAAASQSLASTRSLIQTAKNANAELGGALPSMKSTSPGLITSNASVPAVKNALSKYQQAQILSQMQSTMLKANSELGPTLSEREKERDKEDSLFDDSLLLNDQKNNLDWLSQITG